MNTKDDIIEELWEVKDDLSSKIKDDFSNLDELLLSVKDIKEQFQRDRIRAHQESAPNARPLSARH